METGGLPRAAAGKGRVVVPGRSSRVVGSLAPWQSRGLLPAPSQGAREEEIAENEVTLRLGRGRSQPDLPTDGRGCE